MSWINTNWTSFLHFLHPFDERVDKKDRPGDTFLPESITGDQFWDTSPDVVLSPSNSARWSPDMAMAKNGNMDGIPLKWMADWHVCCFIVVVVVVVVVTFTSTYVTVSVCCYKLHMSRVRTEWLHFGSVFAPKMAIIWEIWGKSGEMAINIMMTMAFWRVYMCIPFFATTYAEISLFDFQFLVFCHSYEQWHADDYYIIWAYLGISCYNIYNML